MECRTRAKNLGVLARTLTEDSQMNNHKTFVVLAYQRELLNIGGIF